MFFNLKLTRQGVCQSQPRLVFKDICVLSKQNSVIAGCGIPQSLMTVLLVGRTRNLSSTARDMPGAAISLLPEPLGSVTIIVNCRVPI